MKNKKVLKLLLGLLITYSLLLTTKCLYNKPTNPDPVIENEKYNEINQRLIVRQIDNTLDEYLANKIILLKSLIPKELTFTGNFAYAELNVTSLHEEFISHSQIKNNYLINSEENNLKINVIGTPEHEYFKAFQVEGEKEYFLRNSDTEYKLINHINDLLKNNTTDSGKLTLYTDRIPCASCDFLIKKFIEQHPNIMVEVIFYSYE